MLEYVAHDVDLLALEAIAQVLLADQARAARTRITVAISAPRLGSPGRDLMRSHSSDQRTPLRDWTV